MTQFPDSPTASIGFGIYYSGGPDFQPLYYPSNFRITTEKELNRTAADCEGQRVSIDELKNSELHVKGKVHASDMEALDSLAHTTEVVEVISPVIVGSGMDAYVKSAERGDIIGYDAYPTAKEWMFEYTIDLVSVGRDEYQESPTESSYEPENNDEDETNPSFEIPEVPESPITNFNNKDNDIYDSFNGEEIDTGDSYSTVEDTEDAEEELTDDFDNIFQ
jgi:hypothetical protein